MYNNLLITFHYLYKQRIMSSKKQPEARFVKKDCYVLAPEGADFVDSAIYALSGGAIDPRTKREKDNRSVPIVLNSVYGGFRLTKEMQKILGPDFDNSDRTNEALVDLVKNLSDEQKTFRLWGMVVSVPYIDYIPYHAYIAGKWSIVVYDGQEKLKIS